MESLQKMRAPTVDSVSKMSEMLNVVSENIAQKLFIKSRELKKRPTLLAVQIASLTQSSMLAPDRTHNIEY